MIESLNIKDIATYDLTGVEINDLKKVNFFFGYNGTGKSTIARYLYNIGLEDSSKKEEFKNCSQNGYAKDQHQILVFDDKFVEDNFKNRETQKGIFSLNQTNDTIDTLISNEEKNVKIHEEYSKNKAEVIEAIKRDKIDKENHLRNTCFEERRAFDSFSKLDIKYARNKENHLNEIKRLLQNGITNIPTIESLYEQYKHLYEKELSVVKENIDSKKYEEIRIVEEKLSRLLSQIIVGNEDVDIAEMITSLGARNWVETGVEYLYRTNDKCPFCQQKTISKELKKQFDLYFDTSYKQKIDELKMLKQQYSQYTSEFLDSIARIQSTYNPSNIVSSLYIDLQTIFAQNISIIERKILTPNERKEIVSLLFIKTKLSNIIKMINQNNNDFAQLDVRQKELMKNIWIYMSSKSEVQIRDYEKRNSKYTKIETLATFLIEKAREKVTESKQKIESWRTQTVNTKDAVDNINIILKNAGLAGFEIAEKEKINNISHYFLKRNGSTSNKPIFKSLSEGEKNFISFLYFYQLCIGTDDIENNVTRKKIIVIDDPVSSLDSQVLFIVSTLIHQLIWRKAGDSKINKMSFKNSSIEQVFILTHNLYFYKEVALGHRPICTDWWHYRITKTNNKTEIIGSYDKTISDDYTLMWKTLQTTKQDMPIDKSQNITISNLMRRIIDSYVSFIGLGRDSWGAVLNENMGNPTFYLKCAFISTINDESHRVSPHDSIYYGKIINEQPQVLFDIFKEIFKAIGKEHYEMMMGEEISEISQAN